MKLLENLRRDKAAKRLYLLVCMLTVLSDEEQDMLELGDDLKREIEKARNDDDFYGKAVAGFGLALTSCYDLTKVDRYVTAQMMTVISETLCKGKLLTKGAFATSDVLSPKNTVAGEWWAKLKGYLSGPVGSIDLSSARIDEVAWKLEEYVNLYNRNIELGEKDVLIGKSFFNQDEDEESYFDKQEGK